MSTRSIDADLEPLLATMRARGIADASIAAPLAQLYLLLGNDGRRTTHLAIVADYYDEPAKAIELIATRLRKSVHEGLDTLAFYSREAAAYESRLARGEPSPLSILESALAAYLDGKH